MWLHIRVLPHPSYSPDLAPSDYHLFGFVKDQLRGQSYETTDAIQKAVRQCLRMAGTEFYRRGIFKLPERWEKCVQRSSVYFTKKLLLMTFGTTLVLVGPCWCVYVVLFGSRRIS